MVRSLPALVSGSPALLTDLYELTMAQAYFRESRNETATFELFVRAMPPRRGYLVFAGLTDVVDYLRRLRFTRDDLSYLGLLRRFDRPFLRMLGRLRFTGELWAMPEGTVFFPGEPVIRVTAPRIEAQLVETFLLNAVNFSILAATKAARIVRAAQGRSVVDFSPRRTHGADASLKVARSSYIGGFDGTSNVLAGRLYGIPVVGTVAHSFVMSYPDERSAFEAQARNSSGGTVFLLDTYDVMKGLEEAIRVSTALKPRGFRMAGVRLDSGNLAVQGRAVRARLDAGGFRDARVFASGDLDEYSIDRLVRGGAPIDSFGVGTALGTSSDSPALGVNYKLVADGSGAGARLRMKLAQGKKTWPGAKQVWRVPGRGGSYSRDVVATAGERAPSGGAAPLLRRVMAGGRPVAALPGLGASRARCAVELRRLPAHCHRLAGSVGYPVVYSPGLRALAGRVAREIRGRNGK